MCKVLGTNLSRGARPVLQAISVLMANYRAQLSPLCVCVSDGGDGDAVSVLCVVLVRSCHI